MKKILQIILIAALSLSFVGIEMLQAKRKVQRQIRKLKALLMPIKKAKLTTKR